MVQKLRMRLKEQQSEEELARKVSQLQLETEIEEERSRRDKQLQDQERKNEKNVQVENLGYRQINDRQEHHIFDKNSDNEGPKAGSQEVDLDTTLATDLNQQRDFRREREGDRSAPSSNTVVSMRKSHLDSGFDESGDKMP